MYCVLKSMICLLSRQNTTNHCTLSIFFSVCTLYNTGWKSDEAARAHARPKHTLIEFTYCYYRFSWKPLVPSGTRGVAAFPFRDFFVASWTPSAVPFTAFLWLADFLTFCCFGGWLGNGSLPSIRSRASAYSASRCSSVFRLLDE